MSSEAIINVKLNLESDDLASQVDKINSELNKVTKNAEKSSESQADASKKATEALKEQNKYTVDLTRNGKGTIASQKETAALVKQIIRQEQARAKTVKQADAAESARENRAKKAAKEEEAAEKRVQDARKKTLKATLDASVELKNITQSSLSQIKNIALGTLTALGLDELFGNVSSSLQKAISDASSIVESENLLRATFNEGADSMLAWADASATAYGLTNIEAKKYLSFITGVLNNTGVANDALESMTTNYVRVVGDLASAFNTETADAFEAIRSGIAGNTTAMQRYGVVLSVANLQQFLNEKGISATYKTLDAASKQYVRYAYIMKSTADIQGDYTNTFDSFANSVKTLKGEWQNFLALVGQYAIPMLKPLISGLATVIAYAQEVIKYLAQIFGWEKYTSAEIDYSYAVKDNVEDTADAQADVTAEVKNTNKAMKQGVKLLDLYTLDFTKDTSSTSTKGTTDKAGQLDDIKGLIDDIDYNIPDKILPEIDIDMSKVKEIGDNIAGAFNVIKGVWDNFFVPFLITPIKNWLDDDLPGKIERLLNTALSLVNLYFGASFLKKKLLTLWNNASPTLKSVLGTIGGTITAAIGGWTLGKAIAESITSGEVDIGTAVTSGINIVSGILTAYISGGPLGGIIATGTALITTIVSTAIESNKQYAEAATKAIDTAMSGTISLSEELESLPLFSKLDTLGDTLEGLDTANKNLGDSITTVVTNLDNLSNSDFEPPEGLSRSEYAAQQLDTLNTSVNNFIDTTAKPIAAAFADSLTGPGGLLESTNQTSEGLKNTLNTALELQAQDISGASQQLAELLAKTDPTPEELERIEVLKKRIESLNAVSKESEIASAFSDIDFSKPNELLDKAEELNTKYRTIQDSNTKFFKDMRADAEALGDDDLVAYWDLQIELSEAQTDNISVQIQDFVDRSQKQATDKLDTLQATKEYTIQYALESNITMDLDLDKESFDYTLDSILDGKSPVEYAAQELGLSHDQIVKLETEGKLDTAIVWTNLMAAKVKFGDFTFIGSNAARAQFQIGLRDFYAGWGVSVAFTDEGLQVTDVTNLSSYLSFHVEKVDTTNLETKLNTVTKRIETRGKTLGTNAANATSEATAEGFESDENTTKMTNAIESGFTSALEDVETPAEAKVKGTDLAKSITSGMTDGFNMALAPESEFMKASEDLTNTLVNIPTKFETAFKNTINNIADYINSLVNSLKEQTSKLNLSSDNVTLGQLYNALTTSNFKIPALANGGVIPPGNPFLAVLGDQRRGMNVEAPVTVIRDAVHDVIQDTGTQTPVEVKVYIGDREIRDFVVDTITANNLIVG